MQDEKVLGTAIGGGALDAGDRAHYDGAVLCEGLLPLPLGEVPAQEGKDEAGNADEKAQTAPARRAAQQKEQGAGYGEGQEHQAQRSPGVGRQQVAQGVSPLYEENLRHLFNLVLGKGSCKIQIVTHIGVGGVQAQGTFVPENGRSDLSALEIRIAQVVIEFLGHETSGLHVLPVLEGLVKISLRISFHARLEQGVGVRERLCLCSQGKHQEKGQHCCAHRGRSLFHGSVNGCDGGDRFFVMFVHGLVTGVGCVTGLFAGIQERGEIGGNGLRNPAGHQRSLDIILGKVCHIHGQLVSHKAQERAVQLLVEGRVQVLLEEILGLCQPLQCLACGLAATGAHDIGPPGGRLPEAQPEAQAGQQKEGNGTPP